MQMMGEVSRLDATTLFSGALINLMFQLTFELLETYKRMHFFLFLGCSKAELWAFLPLNLGAVFWCNAGTLTESRFSCINSLMIKKLGVLIMGRLVMI